MSGTKRERDVVGELQEDAEWSWFTRSTVRWRRLRRPGAPGSGRSILTVVVAIFLLTGTLLGLGLFVAVVIRLVW